MKKVVLPIAFALAFFVVGATLQRAAAETVPFESLPATSFSAPSASGSATGPMPSSIPSTEKVAGLYVAAPGSAQRKANEARGYFYAGVFASEDEAKAYAAGKPVPSSGPRVCMGTSRDTASAQTVRLNHFVPPPSSASARPAPVRPAPVASAKKLPPRPPAVRPSVRFVRSEKLTVANGQATLDVIDAWVDVLTLGARQVARSSFAMKRIATGPNELEVYAAREGRAMQVLVRPPSVPLDGVPEKERRRYLDELQPVADHLGVRTDGGFDTTDCGHIRFSLEYDKGQGQMATIASTAFLLGGVDDEVDDPKPKNDDSEPDEESDRPLAIRTRLVLGNVSLSQAASEKEPVLSITWGWGTKDRIVRF